jgi:hypothetical protein
VGRADHEAAQAVALALPGTARGQHVHRQHMVRDVAGVHQRHHLAFWQQALEPQLAIAASQRIIAGAGHQPANATAQAELVDGLHERQLHKRVGSRQHRQAGDFGA